MEFRETSVPMLQLHVKAMFAKQQLKSEILVQLIAIVQLNLTAIKLMELINALLLLLLEELVLL